MVEIPTTRICLVRHGETEWNTERRIQGHIDIGLNETGLRQAALAGRWLRDAGIAAVYGSDLTRAWVTAQTIAAALGLTPVELPEMRERCYGIFEGLTYAEAKVRYPEAYVAFETRNPDYAYENGESLKAPSRFRRLALASSPVCGAVARTRQRTRRIGTPRCRASSSAWLKPLRARRHGWRGTGTTQSALFST
jgi:broad specificity phosphatase PhoE